MEVKKAELKNYCLLSYEFEAAMAKSFYDITDFRVIRSGSSFRVEMFKIADG